MKDELRKAWNSSYWFGIGLMILILVLALYLSSCARPKPTFPKPDAPMPVYPPNQDEPVNPWR